MQHTTAAEVTDSCLKRSEKGRNLTRSINMISRLTQHSQFLFIEKLYDS